MEKLKQPPELQFVSSNGDLSERWKRWIQTVNLYMDVCLKDTSEKEKCIAFLYIIGQDGRDIYSTFEFETSEVDKIKPLIKKFEEYCIPKQNTTMQRYKFNKRVQGDAELVDQYITELRLLAKDCRFGELQEELIRDRIICSVNSERLQARLLREEDLTLEKAINICKADEESRKQLKDLTKDDSSKVNFVQQKSKKGKDESKLINSKGIKLKIPSGEVVKCGKCGKQHPSKQCPAHGKICHACRKPNHYAKFCRSKKILGVEQLPANIDQDILFVGTVQTKQEKQAKTKITKDECFVTLSVQNTPVEFKVDTGSQANIIPISVYERINEPKAPIQPSKTKLTSYTGNEFEIFGKCNLNCMDKSLNFFVSLEEQPAKLGFRDIIKVVMSTKEEKDIKKKISECFQRLGMFT